MAIDNDLVSGTVSFGGYDGAQARFDWFLVCGP